MQVVVGDTAGQDIVIIITPNVIEQRATHDILDAVDATGQAIVDTISGFIEQIYIDIGRI